MFLFVGDKFFLTALLMNEFLPRSAMIKRIYILALGNCLPGVLEFQRPVVGVIREHTSEAIRLFVAYDYRYVVTKRAAFSRSRMFGQYGGGRSRCQLAIIS